MSKIRVAGHALHPMLIVFPLGLLATSIAWDLAYLSTRRPMWAELAFWTIIAGLIGAALAAVPGFIDWLGIPDGTRAKRVGLAHMLLNVMVLILFLISATWRSARGYETPVLGSMVLGWIGIGLAVIAGWFGGELVERLGVGVWEGANLNAPSSLGQRERPPRTRGVPIGPREPTPTVP
jgi:uncharacterized membrane protein